MALMGGDFKRAQALAKQLLEIAGNDSERRFNASAYFGGGTVLFHLGEFETALAHIDECLSLSDTRVQAHRLLETGDDDVCVALVYATGLHSLLGSEEPGSACADELLARAQALDHPFTTMQSHVGLAHWAWMCRDVPRTLSFAEAGLAVGHQHGLSPMWMASATLFRGWALAMQGDAEPQLRAMRESLGVYVGAGVCLWQSQARACLAEACARVGRVQEAIALVDEALAGAARIGERNLLADIHCTRGELLVDCAGVAEPEGATKAERDFVDAISIARQQRAKLLELRATSSLERLHRRQHGSRNAEPAIDWGAAGT